MDNINLLPAVEKIANMGVYETNLKTGLWRGSDNFISMFGLQKKPHYTVEEFQDLVHPDEIDDVMDYFEKCLKEKRDFDYEYRCIKPNGEIIHVASRSKIHYDSKQEPIKIVGLKQDISEQKKIKVELSKLNKLHKTKNDLMGEIAHDLRAPLAQISALSMLLQEQIDDNKKKWFDLLLKTCDSTNTLISELLEISELNKLESHKINRTKTNLNELIEESILRHRIQLVNKKLTIEKEIDSNIIVFVHRGKFLRMVDNLLNNAIKFTPKGKTITLTAKMIKNKVTLHIKDEGIGIKEQHLPHLFENPKKVSRNGTIGEESTGLGLHIVKQIIDLHQANITVDSKINEGTTFTIELENTALHKAS